MRAATALRLGLATIAVVLGIQALLAATGPVPPASSAENGPTGLSEPVSLPTPTPRATATPQPVVARSILPDQVPTPVPRPRRAPGAPRQVFIIDFGYDPPEMRVKVGESVSWTQEGLVGHDVAFYGTQPTGSGALSSGQSYVRTFSEPGRYMYVCTYHSEMRGVVTVEL